MVQVMHTGSPWLPYKYTKYFMSMVKVTKHLPEVLSPYLTDFQPMNARMSMWGKMKGFIGELLCQTKSSDRIFCEKRAVVPSGEKLALQWVSCDASVEEGEECNCNGTMDIDAKSTENGDLDVDAHHAQADSSFAQSAINMIGMLIGLGQLSTPYALENGGWATAFLLVGLGVISAYTSCLLGKCLDRNPKSRSYSDIGQDAFGSKGRILASVFVYMEIFMALVSYTISLHDNLITVFSGTQLIGLPWLPKLSSSQLLTSVAVLVALPSLWLRDLSSISFLSSGGILMSLVIFTSVASSAIFGGVKANHCIPVIQLRKVPSISGLYIFSYAGHIVFPNLYKSMKDPSKFSKVSVVSFTSVTVLYTALAFMGVKMFGANVSSQITLSMPPHLIVTKIALWATVLTPMTKYALEFAPVAMQLERSLPSSMSSRKKRLIRSSVGSVLLLMILALALSLPYFEHVLGLTGSLVSISICVVLPCAFYNKISWSQIPKPLRILNMTLITFGSLLGAIGTVSSSKLLIQNLQRGR